MVATMTRNYSIRERKDGSAELWMNGEWLETFPAGRADAEKELAHRQEFDKIWSETHARQS